MQAIVVVKQGVYDFTYLLAGVVHKTEALSAQKASVMLVVGAEIQRELLWRLT